MAYKLGKNCIIRLRDHAFIGMTEKNVDYLEYLEWLARGNKPEPAQTPHEIEAEEAQKAAEAALVQKQKDIDADILSNLPSWSQVSTAVDNIADLKDAKAFLKKLSRVVYLVARKELS